MFIFLAIAAIAWLLCISLYDENGNPPKRKYP